MSDIYRAYKVLRSKLSKLSFEDSLAASWAHSQAKHIVGFRFPADVERHPRMRNDQHSQPYQWHLETIIQEVLLHGADAARSGKSLRTWNDMADAINTLRHLEDVIHNATVSSDNIMRELLRIAHQQFPWQKRITGPFIGRYFQVFKDEEIDRICIKLTGLSVPKIYVLGTALWGHYATKPFVRLPWTSEVTAISQQDIDSFFALYSSDVYTFRQRMKSSRPTVGETFSYDQRYIRATPLLSFRKAGASWLACPLPALLAWRFTSGLYYDLTNDSSFFNAFGASFQAQTGRLLSRATEGSGMQCIPEEKFGTRNKSKDTVDWILLDGDAAAFIECKSKRLTLEAKTTLTDTTAFGRDVSTLASYVVQLYRTIEEYKQNHYPSLPYDAVRKIYPVIVTLEDWFPLGTDFWSDLDAQVRAQLSETSLPSSILEEMPFTLASTEELERASCMIAEIGLRGFFGEYHTTRYSGWMLDRYMSDAHSSRYAIKHDLFPETFDEIQNPFLGDAVAR